MSPTTMRRRTVLTSATALGLLGAATACSDIGAGSSDGSGPPLIIPREDMASFSRNFNPFSPNALPMTAESIYEPMLIFNPAGGDTIPWLAAEWDEAEDGTGITFSLREGVTWSDGEPLVADDVVLTLELQQDILDGYPYVTGAEAIDEGTVEFTFDEPFSPALYEIGELRIIPSHIWSEIEDPEKDENPDPVGTGPFTEVTSFSGQSFDLGPNPEYWNAESVSIPSVRMLAFSGNDGANLAAQNGDVDWAPQFMPNIEKTFVDQNPEHNHYWFPATGAMIQWTLNTTQAPFDDVKVRKALSMGIDRERIVNTGMMGYSHPADATGLSDSFDDWRSEEVVEEGDWVRFDPDAAAALLEEAGCELGADGDRMLPDGEPFEFTISVGADSSDWLSVANIISDFMSELGISARVDSPDWAQVTEALEMGTFESAVVWSGHGPTPHAYYRSAMDPLEVKDVDEQTYENYHRFGDEEAREQLQAFTATSDEAEQQEAIDALQRLYSEKAPVVPLFPGPEWGAYTTERFTGWPTEDNPYATLSTRSATTVLVLNTLEPA